MPTVAMTSEVKQYMDSLRSYLTKNPDTDKSVNMAQNDRKPGGGTPFKARTAHGVGPKSPRIVESRKMASVVSTQKN